MDKAFVKNRTISIIEESFVNNPSVASVINRKKPKSLTSLARYAYQTASRRDGVLLSADSEAVAICYPYHLQKEGVKDLWNQLLLAWNCIGLTKLPEVMKREAYVKNTRPADGQFLYFWFFGATARGKKSGAALELKSHIFEWSERDDLPIYLETSVMRNKRVYEYYGFETYHEWKQPNGTTLYFMRRPTKR